MRSLPPFFNYQVFLNYPFDENFTEFSHAMHFAVISAGLLPVCAKDISEPDKVRLDQLLDAINNCRFSAHDLSRCRGEGASNFARMNMPVEVGMALFYSFKTAHQMHRCAAFAPTPHDYKRFASDLSGLDFPSYDGDDISLLVSVYEWLRKVVLQHYFNSQPMDLVVRKYSEFKESLGMINGSGRGATPTHDEAQELMYRICANCGWWEFRSRREGQFEFPRLPLPGIDS